MNAIQQRQLERLEYVSPESLLRSIRPMMEELRRRPEAAKKLPKDCLEKYHGGGLAFMLNHILAQQMADAQVAVTIHAKEFEDSDCVIKVIVGKSKIDYRLVQLKHLPSHEVNDRSEIQMTIDKLKLKYADRVVSIWINRNIEIDCGQLKFDGLVADQLWFFGDFLTQESALVTELRGGFIVDLKLGLWKVATMRNGRLQIGQMQL